MSTKPEGPAQEQSLLDAYKDAEGFATLLAHAVDPSVIGKLEGMPLWNHALIILEGRVPATPAPSQPAGARAQVMKALDLALGLQQFAPPSYRDVLCAARDALLELTQQTAAKDAEIERLTAIAGDLTDRNDALTDESCKLQDDVARIVSSHRSDWSWDDVLSDVRNLKADRDLFQQENARLMDAQEKRELDEKARGIR